MSGTNITEWHFWMASIITGVIMTFAYDILRLLRRIIRHNRFFVDMEDLLFWAACFFTSFTLLYYGNNGVIRFAAVMGAGIGMLAYTLTVGRFFVKYSVFVIRKVTGIVHWTIGRIKAFLHWLFTPVRHLCKALRCGMVKISRNIKYRLTQRTIHHKMNLINASKNGKGKIANGSKRRSKKKPIQQKAKKKKT